MGRRIGLAAVVTALALAGCDVGSDGPGTDGFGTDGPGTESVAAQPTTTVKIVSDLPNFDRPNSNPFAAAESNSIVKAIEFYLEQIDHRYGNFVIEYETFDNLIGEVGGYGVSCVDNAERFVEDEQIVGVIGLEIDPDSNVFEVGLQEHTCESAVPAIANKSSLVYVSPSATNLALTHGSWQVLGRDYPAAARTFARLVGNDDAQGRIGARYMKDLGVTNVYVLDDNSNGDITRGFRLEAKDIGLHVARAYHWMGWNPGFGTSRALMRDVKAKGADGIYIAGASYGALLLRDKVAVVGDNEAVKVLVSDGFVFDSLIEEAGVDVMEGVYGSSPTLRPDELSERGKEFLRLYDERYGTPPGTYAIYGVAALEVLLDALAESDGTRAGVAARLFQTNLEDGFLGPTSFDEYGDLADPQYAIHRVEAGRWTLVKAVRPSQLER